LLLCVQLFQHPPVAAEMTAVTHGAIQIFKS
jgi:hypothetical protein